MIKRKIINTDGLENSENNEISNNQNHSMDIDRYMEKFEIVFKDKLLKVYQEEVFKDDILKNLIKEKMEKYLEDEGKKRIEEMLMSSISDKESSRNGVISNVENKLENIQRAMDYSRELNNREYNFDNYRLTCVLKDYLKIHGYTQTWLSERTKIPKSTLYGIINNTNAPTLENAYRIAMVLNQDIRNIFIYKEEIE